MIKQWNELKASITELRDSGGTGTQQEVCGYLVSLMVVLEKQMQEPCDDTISRQAAIDALGDAHFKNYGNAIMVIQSLPPAQPERKKGQWTDNNACPFCGCLPWFERDIHTLSFCPNCGADLRGKKTG